MGVGEGKDPRQERGPAPPLGSTAQEGGKKLRRQIVGDKEIASISRGMIVAAAPPPTEPRAADRNIRAATGVDGTYHPSRHIEIARAEKITPDPERFVAAHVRHAGIVERWSEDPWRVPQDLPERGLAHDRKGHGSGAQMEMISPIGLDMQVTHDAQHGSTRS